MFNMRRAWPMQPVVMVNNTPYTYDRMTIKVDGVIYDAKSLLSNASTVSGYQCRKCSGQKTRAHARKCPKRGLGHKGREAEARHVEALACDFGIVRHVRRGRRDVGVSIEKVRDDVLRARCLARAPLGTAESFRALIRQAFGPNATFTIDRKTATIDIAAENPTAEGLAMVRDYSPVGVLVRVKGVPV